MRLTILLSALAGMLSVQAALAEIPGTISYQGVVRDDQGPLVQEGDYYFCFKLFDAATGGTQLWNDCDSLHVKWGTFNAHLGHDAPINLAFDRPYWLEVTFEGQTFPDRIALESAPYAKRASLATVADSVVGGTGIHGSGTASYLPKFSGAATLGNSIVYETGSRIGIGTTAPAYKLDVSGDIRASGTLFGVVDNADRLDTYHAGNASGQVALSNGTACINLNADRVDGYHAGNASGQVPVANGTVNTNLNADKVDGADAGNAAGQVALANGTVCTNLNADKVDGVDAGAMAQRTIFGIAGGGGSIYIDFPHYNAFTVVLTAPFGSPGSTDVGFVHCVENDHTVAWQGLDGAGNHVRSAVRTDTNTTIMTIAGGAVTLSTPNDLTYRLKITSLNDDVKGYISW